MSTGAIVQQADYGAFMIDNPDALGDAVGPDWSNGLAFADPHGGAWIATGIYQGAVRVSWSTGEPAETTFDDWEDVVQVVVSPVEGILTIRGFMESGEDGNSPNLVLDPCAQHVLRCSARGRDVEPGGVADQPPFEEYHVDLWLRRAGDDDAVLKMTSSFGTQLASQAASS